MRTRDFAIILGLVAATLQSCSTISSLTPSPYYLQAPSAPLLQTKGNLNLSGSWSFGGGTFDAAYALTNHIGLVSEASLAILTPADFHGTQWSGELGVGVFDTAIKSKLVYEAFAAAGWGTGRYDEQEVSSFDLPLINRTIETGNEKISFLRAWTQVDAGYLGKYASMIFLARLTYVNVYSDNEYRDHINVEAPDGQPHYFEIIHRTARILIATPGFEARFGVDPVHFKAMIVLVIGVSGVARNEPRDPLLPAIGITWRF
jgi:hypothetical protein